VQNSVESDLRDKLESDRDFDLHSVVTALSISRKQPDRPAPDLFIVINVDETDPRLAVSTGLFLRNAGHQVFLSCSRDYEDLVQLMLDVHKYIDSLAEEDSAFRTELLVTDKTLDQLGDVEQIVEEFEGMISSSSQNQEGV
jgi:hypothetical protein